MLIIGRKLEQSFYIGDDIKVTVIHLQKGQVRLGIECPQDIKVMREELKDIVDREV